MSNLQACKLKKNGRDNPELESFEIIMALLHASIERISLFEVITVLLCYLVLCLFPC